MTRQVPEAEADQLRTDLHGFLKTRPDLTITSLTHCTTLSDAAGRNFLSGHLPGGREVVAEFRRVLDLARAGDLCPPSGALHLTERSPDHPSRLLRRGAIYQTETLRRISDVLDYCAANNTIGVITSEFGTGKTAGVRYWRERTKLETTVFEFDEFSSRNKIDFVHQLATLLDSSVRPGSQHGGQVFRALCETLRDHPALLIFDQCETVASRILQIIRQLWDRTNEYGVSVVLLSAPVLATRMTISRAADLGALTSRVGVWAALTGLSRTEMAAIAKREGITDIDDDAFDLWFKSTSGSIRRLMRSIDLLRAKHSGKRISTKTIAGVAAHLWALAIRDQEPAA